MRVHPEEVFHEYKEKTKGEINVSLPGVVLSYDSSTQKATVRPCVRAFFYDEDADQPVAVQMPPIANVPVAFFRAGSFAIHAPLREGDFVTLIVQDRSIDEFMATGNSDNIPFMVRRFNWSDAVALPNPPAPDPIEGLGDDLVVGTKDGGLRVQDDDTIRLEGGGEELVQLCISLIDICLTAQTGMGVPAFANKIPDLISLQTQLENLGGY